jgi:uncharacterized protein (TIGR02058 family)
MDRKSKSISAGKVGTMKRFIIEVGMGVDQHGQDNTRAAEKAVQDAIHRSCLCGLREVLGLTDLNDLLIEVLIACPHPESVDRERVLKALPLGRKKIEDCKGGLLGKTLFLPQWGDKTDEMIVANAMITVYVP